MKGDFSRFTFDPDKHYVGTLMQQGRVQVDADWNEQQAIDRHQRESLAADVIGARGAPNQGGGFAVGLAAGGTDLSLSAGTLYVDGVRVDNDRERHISDQPFLSLAQGGLAGFQWPSQDGRYLVYLDVWERHVCALQDPHIREPALGGPDTATRIQTVWQARLSDQPVGNSQCDAFPQGWTPPGLGNGTLIARTADGTAQGACALSPTAGYRGLENQLYRVEIHRSGIRDNANDRPTLKWSRDNASIATTVTVSGQELSVHDLGRDEVLGFAPNQWVEIIDRRMELARQCGELLQIDTIDTARRILTIRAGTLPTLDTSAPVLLRRWDNAGSATGAAGIPITTAPIALENGIELQFSGGRYVSGDYWLIPARTAIDADTGRIEWPRDGAGQPASKAPDGIRHRYCPLALVDYDAQTGGFSLFQHGDCRPRFPALTRIRAEDVSFDVGQCETRNVLTGVRDVQQALDALCARQRDGCSFVVSRQEDLPAILQQINSAAVTHARICFQSGDFHVDQSLNVGAANHQKGHLVVTGIGAGTRLIADGTETFLRFQNCASVTVRDVSVLARRVGNAGSTEHINGALSFLDCRQVTVEDCWIECASAPFQGASAVTAAYSGAASRRDGSVRVRHCRVSVGHEQIGILTVDAARSHIEDNEIAVAALPASLSLARLLVNKPYRAAARRSLVSHIRYGGPAPADMTQIETVHYGANDTAYFRTAPMLVGHWQALLDGLGTRPPGTQALRERLVAAADRVLLGSLDGARFGAFATWRRQLDRRFRPLAATGVVVSGSTNGGETRILDNSIAGVMQGIRLGYSRRESAPGPVVRALAVRICGNRVRLGVTPVLTRHPEGLFLGSYTDEALVDSNHVSADYSAGHRELHAQAEGIKVHGLLGTVLVVRHNAVFSVDSAIRVVAQNGSYVGGHRWLVADNFASGFASGVDIPANMDQIGNQPGGVSYRDLVAVFDRIRNV